MKKKLQVLSIVFAGAFFTCLFASTASAQSQAGFAKVVVANLYKAKPGPFSQTKSRSLVDKYFTKELADMVWKDATTSKGEVGAIDGDPLYNAQDTEIKKLVIGDANIEGETAMVRVTFTNFGKGEAINYALKKTTNGWRIDDIIYDKDNTLRKWLKEAAASN